MVIKEKKDAYFLTLTGQRQILANKLQDIDFNKNKDEFINYTIKKWKHNKIFTDVVWKDIIKYSFHDNITRTLKLGQKFKDSNDGIYDFIISGYCFGDFINDDGETYGYESIHGLMLLKVDNFDLYCYYKTSPGGCPTCGFKLDDERDKQFMELNITYDIDNIVVSCMSEREVNYTLNQLV